MGLSFTGYLLEKPRLGTSNSPFTASPDNGCFTTADQAAFAARYGTDETTPGRREYMVLTLVDGDLADAEFGWSRNDQVQRFDYAGQDGRFWPLPGGPRNSVGTVGPEANTTRLKIAAPSPNVTTPYRLSVGSVGSGLTLNVALVDDETSFGSPAPGTVQVAKDTGALHWSSEDLGSLSGQPCYYQQQNFFGYRDSTGRLGKASSPLILNPIPETGHHPLIRVGFGLWLEAAEVATDADLSDPPSGGCQWSRETGLLRLSSDVSLDSVIYYDGVLVARGVRASRVNVGTVTAPGTLSVVPEGGDLIFRAESTVLSSTGTVGSNRTILSGGVTGARIGDVVTLSSGIRRKIVSVGVGEVTVSPAFPTTGNVSYTILRVYAQFPETLHVDALGSPSTGQVEVTPTGDIRTAASDRGAYGSTPLVCVNGDILIEDGVSLRLFRTPVDTSGTNPAYKDVSAFYEVKGATWANPMIGAPMVFLPSPPIEDVAFPISVRVEQGTGTFVGPLPRMDVENPPVGLGYVLDFEGRQLQYVLSESGVTIPLVSPTGVAALPRQLVHQDHLSLEFDMGSGYSPMTLGENARLDEGSGVISFVVREGEVVAEGVGSVSGNTLSILTGDFTNTVELGDFLVIPSGTLKGVYTISGVTPSAITMSPTPTNSDTNVPYQVRHGSEVVADTFFRDLSLVDPSTVVEKGRCLGEASNSPRLRAPVTGGFVRLNGEYGEAIVVPTEAEFTTPLAGTIQIAADTRNVQFATEDLGKTAYLFWLLQEGVDYKFEATRGTVQVTERLLSKDELLLSYVPLDDAKMPLPPVVRERATFLVRKEVATHPAPGPTAQFNPLDREVASRPAPKVYRGGRPQSSKQVALDTQASVISFLADSQVTEVLPHGAVLGVSERVMVDYYVYGALGGESTTTALRAPMATTRVVLTEGASVLTLPGDRTGDFHVGGLLRVESDDVYLIGSVEYTSGSTEVTLGLGQTFRNAYTQPKLSVTSGPNPPFAAEMSRTSACPRGVNRILLDGDRTSDYVTGTIVAFSAGPAVNTYYTAGAKFDPGTAQTEVTLLATLRREYALAWNMLRTIRPIVEGATKVFQTSRSPASGTEAIVFRQVAGEVGQVVQAPNGSMDAAGRITLSTPLRVLETLSVFYTGYDTHPAGSLRASMLSTTTPTAENGMAGQSLVADYWVYSPDSFFFRVETVTNYRGEVAQRYKDEAKASGAGGPRTSNSAQTRLFQQGSASAFFDEGAYANEDVVARFTLKFYNDAIHHLEDVLQSLDGRVVGSSDGRFRFDGNLDNPIRTEWASVTNQIDDRFKVSKFPLKITYPGPVVTYLGTYVRAYESGIKSRFYPTSVDVRGYLPVGADTSAETGDTLVDLNLERVLGVKTLRRRAPRALVTQEALVGASVLTVDTTDGSDTAPDGADLLRPPFDVGMKVDIPGYATSLTVTGMSTTTLLVTPSLTSKVPRGATVVLSAQDTSYAKDYRVGFDVGLSQDEGTITYIKPYPPYDGSDSDIPAGLRIQAPNSGEMLDATVTLASYGAIPRKIPALFGGTLTDNGDQTTPLLSPSMACEAEYLTRELAEISGVSASTTPSFVGAGTLNGARTTMTLSSGTFPSPAPQAYDLVRVSGSSYPFHRISSVTANSVTVEVPFDVSEVGTQFVVTVGASLASGASATYAGTTVTDGAANFVGSGVEVGHTLVVTSGSGAGIRRQITGVTSTELTVSPSLPALPSNSGYRVTNSVATFGPSELSSVQAESVAAVSAELTALDSFFSATTTSIVIGSGTGSGTDITTSTYLGDVQPAHVVLVTSGGTTQLCTVVSAEPGNLKVQETLVASGAVDFQVFSLFGMSSAAYQSLLDIYWASQSFLEDTQGAQQQLTVLTSGSPTGDVNIYATGIIQGGSRGVVVQDRQAFLAGAVSSIEAVLATQDRLYDRRWAWIDARVNLENGILTKQSMAVEARLKKQADALKNLIKLLAVED